MLVKNSIPFIRQGLLVPRVVNIIIIIIIIIIINCNWAYARWQCLRKMVVHTEMDIHSRETKHTSHENAARTAHEKTAHLTVFHSTSTMNRIQVTKHRKTNNTQKNEQNTKTKKKPLPGIEPGSSSL
jgi:hypothetical protein